jgi:hypothetical protein
LSEAEADSMSFVSADGSSVGRCACWEVIVSSEGWLLLRDLYDSHRGLFLQNAD